MRDIKPPVLFELHAEWRNAVDSHHIPQRRDALVSTEARHARPVDMPNWLPRLDSHQHIRCSGHSLACLLIRLLNLAMLAIHSSLCVFCGSRANSDEHVFAETVCECAGDLFYPVSAGLSVEGQANVIRNARPMPIKSLKVNCVCRTCNQTWMSKLEVWFVSRLGFLIKPQWPENSVVLIEALKSERDKLAHWLIKTAVTFNHSMMKGKHSVEFSFAVTQKIKDGILPENCWVDLAYSKAKTFGAMITNQFDVINGGKLFPGVVMKNGDGFNFVIQFNHLLLRIARAPHVGEFIYSNENGELPVRLYPTPSPQTPDNFAYEDMMNFQRSIILRTWAGCCGGKAES
jgi:hypothetical protein